MGSGKREMTRYLERGCQWRDDFFLECFRALQNGLSSRREFHNVRLDEIMHNWEAMLHCVALRVKEVYVLGPSYRKEFGI